MKIKEKVLKDLKENIKINGFMSIDEFDIKISDKAIDLTLAEVGKVLDGLIKDYGYCDCKRNSDQMHEDIVKDLEKLKKELGIDVRKMKEVSKK